MNGLTLINNHFIKRKFGWIKDVKKATDKYYIPKRSREIECNRPFSSSYNIHQPIKKSRKWSNILRI